MAILHVRKVPEGIYQRLRDKSEASSRSQRELLEQIRQRRSFRPTEAGAPDSTTLLREDRDR